MEFLFVYDKSILLTILSFSSGVTVPDFNTDAESTGI